MKPTDADLFNWDEFVKFCIEELIEEDEEEGYEQWWRCWKAGYITGISETI